MNGRVDGLLVMSPHVNSEFLWGNVPEGLPAVMMNTRISGSRHSSFSVDNYGGALAMLRHLVEMSRRVGGRRRGRVQVFLQQVAEVECHVVLLSDEHHVLRPRISSRYTMSRMIAPMNAPMKPAVSSTP